MSAAIAACIEVLGDFDESTENLPGKDNKYLPYLLDGQQVGAVSLLLWKAQKLEQENLRLNEMLKGAQSLVDRSIAYLDPDRS